MTLPELISKHSELYPLWEKANARYHETHNEIMCWRIDNKDIGMVRIDDKKSIPAICGMDRGIDIICNHFSNKLPAQSDEEQNQRDMDLEAAIERLREAVNVLEAYPE